MHKDEHKRLWFSLLSEAKCDTKKFYHLEFGDFKIIATAKDYNTKHTRKSVSAHCNFNSQKYFSYCKELIT